MQSFVLQEVIKDFQVAKCACSMHFYKNCWQMSYCGLGMFLVVNIQITVLREQFLGI